MIGEKLKKLRLAQSKTQRAVAKETSFSHSYYGDVETGRTMPSINSLMIFAEYFGVSVGYFFDPPSKCCYQNYLDGAKGFCHCEESACKKCPIFNLMNRNL